MATEHTPHCLAEQARVAELAAEYARLWPEFCRECGGWGGKLFLMQSPLGDDYHFEECGGCLAGGFCPRCWQWGLHDKKEPVVCDHCGWDIEEPDRGIEQAKCNCAKDLTFPP